LEFLRRFIEILILVTRMIVNFRRQGNCC
jgi:hypothetical protein